MIVQRSAAGNGDTANRLFEAIKRHGLTVFARIDHAAAASDVGLSLAPEEVVVFGNPLAGTALMQEDRRIGLELPLRILLWEQGDGVFLAHGDPRDLVLGMRSNSTGRLWMQWPSCSLRLPLKRLVNRSALGARVVGALGLDREVS
ncbi:MAG TPA: DUF302 domain-containing protein [Candidatus Dormibacteraeota bacterium]|nr:DUF302 domain-containing protein [Candidatus Dormibacteraeota bacterium]